MIKILKIYSILFIAISFFSCDNDSVNNEEPTSGEPNNSEVLTSITINSTWVDYVETINFNGGKISNIQYNDGAYHLYTYLGDQISEVIEYNSNDGILFTKSYSYDANGRITGKTVVPNPNLTEWENYQSFEYVYTPDLIVTTYKLFDFDDVQQGDDQIHHLVLNQNTISRSLDPFLGLDFRSDVTYLNDNPITYTRYFSGNITINSTYEYVDALAADAYTIEKFKFGEHWKINSALSYGIPTLGTYVLDDLTTKYLSKVDYNYNYQEQSINNITTYSYEFDEDNLLLSQTQTKDNSGVDQDYVTVITYEYE